MAVRLTKESVNLSKEPANLISYTPVHLRDEEISNKLYTGDTDDDFDDLDDLDEDDIFDDDDDFDDLFEDEDDNSDDEDWSTVDYSHVVKLVEDKSIINKYVDIKMRKDLFKERFSKAVLLVVVAISIYLLRKVMASTVVLIVAAMVSEISPQLDPDYITMFQALSIGISLVATCLVAYANIQLAISVLKYYVPMFWDKTNE